MNQNLFEVGTRSKMRFATSKGNVSIEELWDFSLESLDTVAKSINKQLKDESEESFIGKKTTAKTELENKLEILKYIIGIKIEEKDLAKKRAENRAKLAQLKELAASKSNEALNGKSLDEINKMIAELSEEV